MSVHRPLTIFVPHCSDLLTDHRPHGDGLVACGFIRRLAERGHQLHVAVSSVDLKDPLPANVLLYPIKDSPGAFWSRCNYVRRVRKLFMGLRTRVAFDIVHQLNPVYTGVSLGLARSPAPIILGPYIGGWPDDPLSSPGPLWTLRGVLAAAKGMIVAMQQRFADSLLLTNEAATSRVALRSNDRNEILPHGIDSQFFCPLDHAKSEPSRVEILFMANLGRRKGIFDLLQAFELVAARYENAHLAVAGDGPELPEVKRAASLLAASERIRFLGRQDRAGAVNLLQNTDVYCLPSHGEPYGMTAVEAMSCGKPLVVTNAGGLGCLVDDQGGVRVPVANPEHLAAALCALVADPARRIAMGNHNRQRVLETMAWDRVIDRLEQIYVASIERKRRGGSERSLRPAILAQTSKDCA